MCIMLDSNEICVLKIEAFFSVSLFACCVPSVHQFTWAAQERNHGFSLDFHWILGQESPIHIIMRFSMFTVIKHLIWIKLIWLCLCAALAVRKLNKQIICHFIFGYETNYTKLTIKCGINSLFEVMLPCEFGSGKLIWGLRLQGLEWAFYIFGSHLIF